MIALLWFLLTLSEHALAATEGIGVAIFGAGWVREGKVK
jgi:hypothetical protein